VNLSGQNDAPAKLPARSPNDQMKAETIIDDFKKFLDGLNRISDQTKALVVREAERKARSRDLKGDDSDTIFRSLHFAVIRTEIVKEQWVRIDPEERIFLCYPGAVEVGKTVVIPNRGKGVVLSRKLTNRQGLEFNLRMEDGSNFSWEFFD
jgi:hypothetical protein